MGELIGTVENGRNNWRCWERRFGRGVWGVAVELCGNSGDDSLYQRVWRLVKRRVVWVSVPVNVAMEKR